MFWDIKVSGMRATEHEDGLLKVAVSWTSERRWNLLKGLVGCTNVPLLLLTGLSHVSDSTSAPKQRILYVGSHEA